jgi:photosystem II stability/assembly factor-like uncharacterized protein
MHCVSVGSLTSSQGSEVAIYSSSDTGATWSRVSTSVTGALYSVSCVSATQCRAVGYSKTTKGITEVSMSTNNGTTWASTPMTGIGILISISCSTMNLCAIIGGDKNLNTFTSTLVSGVLQKTSSSPNIRSEVVCSPSRCSIASVTTKGVVFADSTNGGKSYSTVSTLSVATGQAKSPGLTLSCPSVSLCIAVSDDGFISRRY